MELIDSFVDIVLFVWVKHDYESVWNVSGPPGITRPGPPGPPGESFLLFLLLSYQTFENRRSMKSFESDSLICYFYERVVESSFFVVDDTNVFPTDLI